MSKEETLGSPAKGSVEDRIPVEVQQVLDEIHRKYGQLIAMMTQENAALQAQMNNAEAIIAEQDAKLEAYDAFMGDDS